jgi:Ca2+-transporting ATPase
VLKALDVAVATGLEPTEVKCRQQQFGANRLQQAASRSAWRILLDQFKSLIVVLLVGAAALAFLFDEWVEGVAILAVILINALIGFVTEWRAVRSMEALRQLGSVYTKVRRAGRLIEVPAEELVPGDIVILEAGDVVTADLRLLEASRMQVDESLLTGESVPVGKTVGLLQGDVPLAERSNMVFKGTAITRGSGSGVVVATGMQTELGRISSLVAEAAEDITPLEQRLDALGRSLIGVTLLLATLVAAAGWLSGKDLWLMIETAIALAVATIPEGLPIVATVALARGMWRMAQRQALINRLSAVETLGATTVICTDKTGTLTENRLTVTRLVFDAGVYDLGGDTATSAAAQARNGTRSDATLREALLVAVLCNNAALADAPTPEAGQAVGDPLEVALLVAGANAGLSQAEVQHTLPKVREEAFDPDVKMMATFHTENHQYRVAVKGAPEAVLAVCTRVATSTGVQQMRQEDRQRWQACNLQMAKDGLRVLALATRHVDSPEVDPYEELTWLGLVGLLDPPRPDVRPALAACREAGIKVVMVTGDQPVTARHIALAVGLVEADEEEVEVIHGNAIPRPEEASEAERQRLLQSRILARVTPRQKLDIIALYQRQGAVVAMTGDGVNDAPALKKADIGIAMGQRGTQVAREAADMVLQDDAFATIVVAIEQGRIIFGNIRKFVLYLLSCNVSEVMIVALASFMSAQLPILPLQILFLNLVTDVFPALALGVGRGNARVLQQPPRHPTEPILTRRHWLAVGGSGLLITGTVLGAFALTLTWLGLTGPPATTLSFLTLALAQLWHVFNMRDSGTGVLSNDITRNLFVWGALILCVGLLLAAVYVPPLAAALTLTDPGIQGWGFALVLSLVPLVGGQIWHSLGARRVEKGEK